MCSYSQDGYEKTLEIFDNYKVKKFSFKFFLIHLLTLLNLNRVLKTNVMTTDHVILDLKLSLVKRPKVFQNLTFRQNLFFLANTQIDLTKMILNIYLWFI